MKIQRPKRLSTFSVTCTDEEKAEVSRRAAEKDMSISAYIRWLVRKEAEQNGEL